MYVTSECDTAATQDMLDSFPRLLKANKAKEEKQAKQHDNEQGGGITKPQASSEGQTRARIHNVGPSAIRVQSKMP